MSAKNGKANELTSIATVFAKAKDQWRASRTANVEALYRAARKTRFTRATHQVGYSSSSEDNHYASESDFFRIMEMARDLDRNDLVIGQGISRMVNNIVQDGFQLDPKTGNKGADELLKLLWNQWSSDRSQVDLEREKSFHDIERLTLRHVVVDGDVVLLPLKTGSLQMVEGHRLRTPYRLESDRSQYTIHGVELDSSRRRVGYWLTADDIAFNDWPDVSTSKFYPAFGDDGNRLVHHLYYPRRMTQTRGVSRLAPITDAAALHDDIQFAKLIQQQSVSVWALIRERELGFEYPEGVTEDNNGWTYEADPCREGQTRPVRNVSAGMWYTGYPGERVSGFSPNVPNPTYFDHARQVMQIMSINLDLPLIVFLMDASETNFSGWRGAMEQAKIAFRMFQRWYASILHEQVYAWKIRQWSTPGSPLANPLLVRMRQRGLSIFDHEWVTPTWPYVEPMTDASADLLELSNGLNSPRRIQSKRGRDWDVVSTEITEDLYALYAKAADAAVRFGQEFPEIEDPPTWREFARNPMPSGQQMGLAQVIPQEPLQEPKRVEAKTA